MAKVASPYGLRAVNLIGAVGPVGSTRQIKIASGYATDIFNGDIVMVGGDGTLQKMTKVGTAASAFDPGTVGVFCGVQLFTGGPTFIGHPTNNMWVGGTVEADARGFVLDDPGAIFMIQANGSLDQEDLHRNFGIVQTAGESRTGVSRIALDTTTRGTAAGIAFKVIDFVRNEGSKPGDEFTDVLVKFNPSSHAYTNGTGVSDS